MGSVMRRVLGGWAGVRVERALVSTVVACAIGAGCKKAAIEQASAQSGDPVPSSASSVRAAPLPGLTQSDQVPVSAEAKESCRAICERSSQLKCKNTDECVPNCLAMASLTPCTAEIATMFGCILREPIAHWECAEDGVGAIRDGYCNDEQGKAVACMEQKMQP